MDRRIINFLFLSFLSYCSCELSYENRGKLLNGFIDFYNSLPNQIYTCEEGYLKNAQQSTEQNSYIIDVILKLSEVHNLDSIKYLKCTGKVVDLDVVGISVLNHHCEETSIDDKGEIEEIVVTETSSNADETPFVRKPVQLDNEVQTNTAVTSGEQFIAIPREEPKVNCIGCSSHVNPQAKGVSELASIGVRQLNSLEPNVQYTLNSVVDVERQVQVVNGIRYILTLIIDYNSCLAAETESCLNSKACKITFLEKPWMQLPDGSKYRAILANNCTKEWRFGDDGVVIPQTPADSREFNNINPPQTDGESDIIKPVHNVDVQTQQLTEKTLTDDNIKAIEDQIIPIKKYDEDVSESTLIANSEPTETLEPGKEHAVKPVSDDQFSPNSIPLTDSVKIESLSEDKKKAIDDMLSFFNFGGFDSATSDNERSRLKRSYDNNLHMNLVEKSKKVKKNIEHAEQKLGGETNQNPNEPKYKALAEESMHKYLESIGNTKSHKILKVNNVTTQVVSGSKTKIDFEISPSDQTDGDVITCHSEIWEQLWLKKKEIDVKCSIANKSRTKRRSEEGSFIQYSNQNGDSTLEESMQNLAFVGGPTREKRGLPGGEQVQNPNDSKYKALAEESTHKYLQSIGNTKSHKILKINHVTTQVVSGRKTKIDFEISPTDQTDGDVITCHSEIWEQPWLKKKEIDVKCSIDNKSRTKRRSEEGSFIQYFNQNGDSTLEESMQNLAFVGGPTREKRGLPGGEQEQNPNDPKYKALAEESMHKYLESIGNTKSHKILKINHVTTQVVSGSKTKIDFEISPSDQTDGDVITCHSEIWEQLWLKKKEIDVKCSIANKSRTKRRSEEGSFIQYSNQNGDSTLEESMQNLAFVGGPTREKRGLPGGEQVQNPNDSKYKALAEESTHKYLQSIGNTKSHKILKINHVTTQVVSGRKTKIDFEISPTDQTDGDVITCHSEIWEQPWLKKKEIDVKCSIDNKSRTKRRSEEGSFIQYFNQNGDSTLEESMQNLAFVGGPTREKRGLPGGEQEQNPNDPEYKALAEESMHKYLESIGNTKSHKILKINHVTTQVVSGSKTKIDFEISPSDQTDGDVITCHSEIWEQLWLKKKEIDVKCSIANKSRTKRRSEEGSFIQYSNQNGDSTLEESMQNLAFVGGPTSQGVNNPKIKELAKQALRTYLKESVYNRHYDIIDIKRATVQVVAGTLTEIEFDISPTTCLIDREGNPSSSDCKILDNNDITTCTSKIWEKPWIAFENFNTTCHANNKNVREKRGLPGGEQEQNPNDPKYKALAEESMHKYLESIGNTKSHKILKINHVTTQVVSGSKTKIDFEISPSDQTDGDVITCHSEIWEQLWLKKKEIDVKCSIANKSRTKRRSEEGSFIQYSNQNGDSTLEESMQNLAFVGGPTSQGVNNPKIKELAKQALRTYLKESVYNRHYDIIDIKRATVQVVAGTLTEIEFDISPTTCLIDREGNPSSSDCKILDNNDITTCTSKIWEKPWIAFENFNTTCHANNKNVREKRGLPGGEQEQNPNDPKYKALAEESMHKYLESIGNTKSHKILKINHVTTQVVSGSKTKIDFEISPSDQTDGDVITCHSEIWEQLWLKKKEIDVKCSIDNKSRTKRRSEEGSFIQYSNQNGDSTLEESMQNLAFVGGPTREKRGLAGGEQEQNPNDPEYKALAEESMHKYLQSIGNTKSHKILKINHVTTQVVSGSKTKIDFEISPSDQTDGDVITCHSEIWEQLWLKKKEIDVDCSIANKSRTKRRSEEDSFIQYSNQNGDSTLEESIQNLAFVGGPTSQGVNNPKIKELAKQALRTYLKESVYNRHYDLIDIKRATVQVVAGTLTEIEFDISPTTCLIDREGNPSSSDCKILDNNDITTCTSKIWEKPWIAFENFNTTCHANNKNVREKRGLPGGEQEQNPNDPKYKALAEESMHKYLQSIGNTKSHKILKINHVTTQVVSGSKTKIDFEISPSDQTDGDVITCHSEIWEQSWLKKKEIDVKCNIDKSRTKRGILHNTHIIKSTKKQNLAGGPQERDPTKSEYRALAQETLKKYLKLHRNSDEHKVVEVKKVTTKIVSGIKYSIEYIAAPLSCANDISTCESTKSVLHCDADVWDRPWLGDKEIGVVCQTNNKKMKTMKKIKDVEAMIHEEGNREKRLTHSDEKYNEYNKQISRKRRSVSSNSSNSTADTTLETNVEFESAQTAMILANEALKHIEAKYPNPRKQKVVRIFSLEKKVVAGIHYRMKIEVGSTQCSALSAETNCTLQNNLDNKFCRVNIWVRPWTDHLPKYRVTCDYQEGAVADLYYHLQAEQLFSNFLTTYKPEYINKASEMRKRFVIFKQNIRKIHKLNTHEKGTATYGVTRFADLSYEEFSRKFLGLKPSLRDTNQVPMRQAEIPDLGIPEAFDWRELNAVTEVKDQGSCGSCWAFSVTGNIEGQWKMRSGNLVSLSEQELVDCDKLDDGCNGGLPDNAYRAIEQLGGLELESDYPYEGEDDKCSFNKTMSRVQITGAVNITSNETGMAKWLVQNGPISIGINANAMQFYMGGVSHPWKMLCNPTNLDHGVLIVGYGIKDYPMFHKRLPYWTIKNSWGPGWGEQGYYRVFRGDGTCGVNQMASSAVV